MCGIQCRLVGMVMVLGLALGGPGCIESGETGTARFEGAQHYTLSIDELVVVEGSEGDAAAGFAVGEELSLRLEEREPGLLHIRITPAFGSPVDYEGRIDGSFVELMPLDGRSLVVTNGPGGALSVHGLQIDDLSTSELPGRLEGVAIRFVGNESYVSGCLEFLSEVEGEMGVAPDLEGPQVRFAPITESTFAGSYYAPVPGRDRPLMPGERVSVQFSEPVSATEVADLATALGADVHVTAMGEMIMAATIEVRADGSTSSVPLSFPGLKDAAGNLGAPELAIRVIGVEESYSRISFESEEDVDSWGAAEISDGCASGSGCLGFTRGGAGHGSTRSQGLYARLTSESATNFIKLQARILVTESDDSSDALTLNESLSLGWIDEDSGERGTSPISLSTTDAGDSGWVSFAWALPEGVQNVSVHLSLAVEVRLGPVVPPPHSLVVIDDIELSPDFDTER